MKELYENNKRVIRQIYQLIQYINRQDEVNAIWFFKVVAKGISEVVTSVLGDREQFFYLGVEINEEYIISVLQEMLIAQQQNDYISYGDILQIHLLPILLDIQEAIRQSGEELLVSYWDQNMAKLKDKDVHLYKQLLECDKLHGESVYGTDIYNVEEARVGDVTVSVSTDEQRLYLHSCTNPIGDVKPWIDSYYDVYKSNYVIYGLGLGYHAQYLAAKDCDLDITIIENDIGIIQLAMTYTDMNWYFSHSGVRIIYDANWTCWADTIRKKEDVILLLHQPSVNRIKQESVLKEMKKYLVYEGSVRARGDRMIRNFLSNQTCCNTDLTRLQEDFKGKNVVIVAAGPSLDQNVHLLKNRYKDTIVLAMGAVCKKLYHMGITMDYIIITDPKEISNRQIQGVEHMEVPMILLSTATKGVARYYKGEKYMLCQKGFPDAEQYACERGLPLFETGGSVATTALDLCVRFDVNKIIFIGLDMAYTGNKNHAEGARDEGITDYEDMLKVEDIYGNLVPTTQPFDNYRRWIEKRMKRDDVKMPVIDATEGGARIEGTDICTLREALEIL